MKPDAYIICATPRSGSTLLCDLLSGTGVTGHPNSYFRRQSIPNWVRRWGLDPDVSDFDHVYMDAVRQAGTAGKGMFGLRQMWDHKLELDAVLARLFPDRSEMEQLEAAFGSIRFLYLKRQDLVAQAVSRAKAEQSGLWHKHSDGSPRELLGEFQDPTYDAAQIAGFLAEADQDDRRWNAWFTKQRIEPLRLSYENLDSDPQGTLDRILQAFDLGPAKAVIKSQQLADKENADWVTRFRSEST